jgi:Cellulase (glycosyl hydrolase family 5)
MSPSTAREERPARMRSAFVLSLAYFTSLIGLACSNPEPQVIARFPAVSGANAGGAGGSVEFAGGGLDGGDAGSVGTAGMPFTIPLERGRVKVFEGKLVTDVGTPLRGLLLPVDTKWDLADLDFLHELATTTGLNAVHVYLENSGIETGLNHLATDALVPLAAREGLYVVIGYGTGMKLGTFDPVNLKAFWTYYAGRYASYSNVVYEIQNDPQGGACAAPISDNTLAMEQQMYTLIRSKAPDTHILMFSTTNVVKPNILTQAVKGLGSTVDWTNASFAVGASGTCVAAADFQTVADAASAAGVSLFLSQLPPKEAWQVFIPPLEKAGVGWLQYRWFGDQTETLATFNQAITKAKLTWCPERGTFPENASTCH